MRARNFTEPRIEFVFGEANDQLSSELKAFWSQYGKAYENELSSFRDGSSDSLDLLEQRVLLIQIISEQIATISRDQSGAINGIVFVALQEMKDSLELGSHAYFQRMYIIPEHRHPRLANQLFRAFLQGFGRAMEQRDHRAKVLLAKNINPGLQKASMRRYFSRLGYQMLGDNRLGGEIWCKKLETRFYF